MTDRALHLNHARTERLATWALDRDSAEAGAPEWKRLLEDDEAIDRMARCLMDIASAHLDAIPVASLAQAKSLISDLLRSALGVADLESQE